jgi:hypothetical protein
MAEEVKPAFRVDVAVSGAINYFSGQTNSAGLTVPVNPHRFLALERLKISLDFNRAPLSAEITFAGREIRLTGAADQKHFDASLIIPRLPSTITWDGRRLADPLTLRIHARDRSSPSQELNCDIQDVDITGDVYDITYAQVND